MLLVHSWVQTHREAANVLDVRAMVAGRWPLAETAAALVDRVRLCASGTTGAGVIHP
jgi:hypothetical protein